MVRLAVGRHTVSFFKEECEAVIVPRKQLILDLKTDTHIRLVRVAGVMFHKLHDIDDTPHRVRANRFFDIAVLKLERDGFTVVVISFDLIDHGIVCMNILPESQLRFAVQIDHLFDMHDIGADQIDHVAVRHIISGIVDRNDGIILIPAEIFFPRQIVAVEAAVRLRSKFGM